MLIQIGERSCDFRPWYRRDGRVFNDPFALDTETTPILGHEVPRLVLAAACDGKHGFFLPPGLIHDFLAMHWDLQPIFHSSAFDLAVLNALLKRQGHTLDIYDLVDRRQVWDTELLHKLYFLATAGHTCQGKGQSTLETCASHYLKVTLPKKVLNAEGNDIRLSWGQWEGRPARDIPDVYLEYLGKDVLCTYGCWAVLVPAIMDVLGNAHEVWGYVDHEWLTCMTLRYGPQTHDLQLMGVVALDAVERVGFGLDMVGRDEILPQVQQRMNELREELRHHGYLEGEEGCGKVLQALIRQTLQQHPDLDIPLTDSGKDYSTREEHLDTLAEVSNFFAVFKEFCQARALLNKYLRKMNGSRIHPYYDPLKNTGRTASRNPNIQGFPRKKKKKAKHVFDLRRCFVPASGKVFYVVDYASIELRTLSQAVLTQFRLESRMAEAINAGQDLHRLVAARMKVTGLPDADAVLTDSARFAAVAAALTKDERDAAKPANFGLPAGMGAPRLKDYAKVEYDQPYTEEDARKWIEAWLASFPEMVQYRKDDFDGGLALARELHMTPESFSIATGGRTYGTWREEEPAGWLGGMALKVLREDNPVRRNGGPYSPEEIDYFWGRLQLLEPRLKPKMAKALQARQPSEQLRFAVQKVLNRAGVFTLTGRLRAKASYSARRNTVFQGAAADGAKLALYRLWRAGFTVVAFIHDEVVIEVDASADLAAVKDQVDGLLVSSMKEICPDILIEVEGSFRRRWGKDKADEIPLPLSKEDEANEDPVGPKNVVSGVGQEVNRSS